MVDKEIKIRIAKIRQLHKLIDFCKCIESKEMVNDHQLESYNRCKKLINDIENELRLNVSTN